MSNYEKKLREGQWVWYKDKNSIIQGAITRIENNTCIFEAEGCPTVKIEENKCYISFGEMSKAKNDNEKKVEWQGWICGKVWKWRRF